MTSIYREKKNAYGIWFRSLQTSSKYFLTGLSKTSNSPVIHLYYSNVLYKLAKTVKYMF